MVMTSVAGLPAPSVAVTVIALGPEARPTPITDQLVVPEAVPEPPVAELAQLTLTRPERPASEAVPEMVAEFTLVMKVGLMVGPVIWMDGAWLSLITVTVSVAWLPAAS